MLRTLRAPVVRPFGARNGGASYRHGIERTGWARLVTGDPHRIPLRPLGNVGELLLIGALRGKNIRARLRTVPDSNFLLRNRGFHWINEFPFNR